MPWTIRFTNAAERSFGDLPRPMQARFAAALELLAKDPFRARPSCHIEPLEGLPGARKLRIGRYRGIYEIHGTVVLFTRFGHRSTVYR